MESSDPTSESKPKPGKEGKKGDKKEGKKKKKNLDKSKSPGVKKKLKDKLKMKVTCIYGQYGNLNNKKLKIEFPKTSPCHKFYHPTIESSFLIRGPAWLSGL